MHPEDIKTEKRIKYFATLTGCQIDRRADKYAWFSTWCHNYGRRMTAQSRLTELVPNEVERWRICEKYVRYDGLRVF